MRRDHDSEHHTTGPQTTSGPWLVFRPLKKTEESRVELRRYKERLEIIGLIAMGVGMVFLVQPLTLVLFSLGFPILLVGLIFYIVVCHF
jgi:hypothetical protein